MYCTTEERENNALDNADKPMRNPYVVLREEFDDWAILFDPDTCHGFGLNPAGVYVWKFLDGRHSIGEVVSTLRSNATELPEQAPEQILVFVEELTQHGLVLHGPAALHEGVERISPRSAGGRIENLPDRGQKADRLGPEMLCYERPRLEPFSPGKRAYGCCGYGSHDSVNCIEGAGAGDVCYGGCSATMGRGQCKNGGCACNCCTGTTIFRLQCTGGNGDSICCSGIGGNGIGAPSC